MKITARCALIVICLCSQVFSQTLDEAMVARGEGELDAFVETLRTIVAADPDDFGAKLLLAETLGWMEEFQESEALYRDLLRNEPDSLQARRGLGLVLLWQGRSREALAQFEAALEIAPDDPETLAGATTAAWWSGDWRGAERYARATLAADSSREEPRTILRDLDLITAPILRITSDLVDDDQPYRLLQSSLGYTGFSDPLTSWQVQAGTYVMERPERSELAPFASIGARTSFPASNLSAGAEIRFLEFPDGESTLLGGAALEWTGAPIDLTVSWNRDELLRTRTAIDDHPRVDSLALRLSRPESSGWTGAASVRALDYYDGNRGLGVDLWLLSPRLRLDTLSIAAGPSIAYRDTEESRFIPGFPTGSYDPYWTPEELLEVRAVVDLIATWQNVVVRAHADGGWGEETVTPEFLTREFHPWRASLSVELPLLDVWALSVSAGRESTAFYEATQISASVARRF